MIALTKVAETATTITLGWQPVPGCLGYVLYVDGVRKSSSWDPAKSTWRVSKGGAYRLVALGVEAAGTWTPPPAPSSGRPFAASSPFNALAVGTVRSDSAALVARVLKAPSPNLCASSWGVRVVTAQPSDPVRTVTTTVYHGGADGGQVHVPAGTVGDPSEDGHLAIIDGANVFGFWGHSTPGTATAWAAERSPLTGDGVQATSGAGANAAGYSALAGVIRVDEVKAGRIDHALVFGILNADILKGSFVPPAVHTDGGGGAGSVPMGTRFQLDPAFDVSALPSAWLRVIAKAMQEYGLFLRDSSGSLAVYAETGRDAEWKALGVTGNPSLAAIPWNRLRAITG